MKLGHTRFGLVLVIALSAGCATREQSRATMPSVPAPSSATLATSAEPEQMVPIDTPTPASRAQPLGITPTPPPPPPGTPAPRTPRVTGLTEIFPGVRVDRAAGVVEFDAVVPIDPRDETTPTIYLEVIACPRDTKEHESLLVTDVKPSQVHAGLLLIGLVPGAPGHVGWKDNAPVRVPPTGPTVDITFRFTDSDGKTVEARPQDWIINATDGRPMLGRTGTNPVPESTSRWLFAGSVTRQAVTEAGVRAERYEADSEGTLIGFATFGSELLAFADVISHESSVDAPTWIADAKTTPPVRTKVVVVLRAATAR